LDVESKVLLKKEVSNIAWFDPTRNHLTVTCSDGTKYDADHVISTVSLGVLKENYKSLFTPNLPAPKINAIEGLSFGAVDKIFVEFEKPFWDENWSGFSLLWSLNDSQSIRSSSDAWMEDIFGFYRVDYQPNILCGWISGPSARFMERLDNQTVMKGVLFLFDKFIGSRMKWTKPVKMLRSSWYSNNHFRGSYSYRSVTTDLLKTSANDLAHPLSDPLGKPILLFGGEATSEHYYSTVHGAIEAGWREASRLIDFYTR
jgi:spermine oxidase